MAVVVVTVSHFYKTMPRMKMKVMMINKKIKQKKQKKARDQNTSVL